MKVFKALFILVLVLIITFVVGAVIFLKTADFNQFREQIMAQASHALGRDVFIDKLDVAISLKKGTVLDVAGLRIAGDERWGTENFLEVERLYLDVNLLTFLMEQKIHVANVRVIRPKIRLMKNQYGRWNTHDLSKKAEPSPDDSENSTEVQDKSLLNSKKRAKEVLVQSVQVEKGEVTFIDTSNTTLPPIVMNKVDFSVNGLSIKEEPFDFNLKSSLWSDRQNFSAKGKMRISAETQQARFDDVAIKLALSKAYEDHTESPILDHIKQLKQWRGKLNVLISQMVVGKEGILVLSAEGKLDDSEARIVDLPLTLKNIVMTFEATENDIEVSSYSFELGSGKVLGSAQLDNYQKEYRLRGKSEIVRLRLPELIELKGTDARLQGELFGLIEVEGRKSENFVENMTGKASFQVQGGRLVGVNIIKMVFRKITFIPSLIDVALETLPNKYKRILKETDTEFRTVNIEVKLNEGRADIERVLIVSEKYQVELDGYCEFNLNSLIRSDVYLSEEFSEEIMESIPEFQGLLEADGRVHIPFKPYRGPIDRLKLSPDIDHLSRNMLIERGSQELEKLLDKVLDRDDGGSGSEGKPSQPSPERVIIEGVLDSIFGESKP